MKTIIRILLTLALLAMSIVATMPQTASAAELPSGYAILGYHTVRAGETLFCIGRAYQVSPWAIAAQNGINAVNAIYAGQVLAIPNAPWNAPAGPTCARQIGNPPPPPPVCRAYYSVRFGDTLLGIARWFGVDVYTLAARNNVYNLNRIFAGSVLCIP
jgi:LysM repeat protein